MDPSKAASIRLPASVRAAAVPGVMARVRRAAAHGRAVVDFGEVRDFDSSALALLAHLRRHEERVAVVGVPSEMDRAVTVFEAEVSPPPAEAMPPRRHHLTRIGEAVLAQGRGFVGFLSLLADEIYHVSTYLRRRRGVYPGETWNQLFFMAVGSFPIVAVLVFLVSVTIALMSANQLRLFGADIYLADFVGLANFREMVPLMTGVILSGKVGAAVTAELSTMVVLEEVDALQTMGVVPERFLMVPRLLGMTLAIPLLVGIADAVGLLGGILVGWLDLGIPASAFIDEMRTSVFLSDFVLGLIKTMVFGWAIILASGYKGLSAGRSAGAVGRATTQSVVLSIALIIAIDCIFAFGLYGNPWQT